MYASCLAKPVVYIAGLAFLLSVAPASAQVFRRPAAPPAANPVVTPAPAPVPVPAATQATQTPGAACG